MWAFSLSEVFVVEMTRVYVGIGSNIEPEKNIRRGLGAMRKRFGKLELSKTYETKAMGFEGDNFLNLVAAFDTELEPSQIAGALREIEDAQGRVRDGSRFSSRTLDLDMLLYGDLVQHRDEVDVPRGEILEYAFVLCPLADIASEARHPESGDKFGALWARFEREESEIWPADIEFCG